MHRLFADSRAAVTQLDVFVFPCVRAAR